MNSSKGVACMSLHCALSIIPPLFLLLLISISLNLLTFDSFSSFDRVKSLFSNSILFHGRQNEANSTSPQNRTKTLEEIKKEELQRSRIAVCMLGGARRFELTGPSIVENVLKEYPNAELFLHSPLDGNSFKFSLLKAAPRIASVKIFQPMRMQESGEHVQLLNPAGSPNGIQGLIQYFNLVEGCLTLIRSYQEQKNFTYDWIVRSRVDGYWNAPLNPNNFIPGQYVVPSGSLYAGLNDRIGIGDLNSSIVALSRLSLLVKLYATGLRRLNSESAFKAQLTTHGIPYTSKRIPFCVVSDRICGYPPGGESPVVAISSLGPLSGAYCRPCTPACNRTCVNDLMSKVPKQWSWTDWEDEKENFQLCDPRKPWENGWEEVFDKFAEPKFVSARKQASKLALEECIADFEQMKRGIFGTWDAPASKKICELGLASL